jgi:hypothetical protein
VLALAGAAHAQATLHTAITSIDPGNTAICIAANVSTVDQDIRSTIETAGGRKLKDCFPLAPRGFCKSLERTAELAKGLAYCKFEVLAPGGASDIVGSLLVKDAAGNLVQMLEAKQ